MAAVSGHGLRTGVTCCCWSVLCCALLCCAASPTQGMAASRLLTLALRATGTWTKTASLPTESSHFGTGVSGPVPSLTCWQQAALLLRTLRRLLLHLRLCGG